jgi:hypothetical protein
MFCLGIFFSFDNLTRLFGKMEAAFPECRKGILILKQKDEVAPLVAERELLLKTPGLKKVQREEIENEIWVVRAGAKGEAEAAYHIDFTWKDSRNHVALHDLRIEDNAETPGRVTASYPQTPGSRRDP